MKHNKKSLNYQRKIKNSTRKHLSADVLFSSLKGFFTKILDYRNNNTKISLADTLMSAFAMFSLKDSSLLAFDKRRNVDSNLKNIYKINDIPCDTQMREILDDVDPECLRPSFKKNF